MKKIILIITILFPLFLNSQNDSLNKRWIRLDKSNLLKMTDIIKSKDTDLKNIKKKIKKLYISHIKNIGFGASYYGLDLYGGYTSVSMTICTFNDETFYMGFSYSSDDIEFLEQLAQKDTIISNVIRKYWKKSDVFDGFIYDKSLDYKFINDSLYLLFKQKVSKELGYPEEIKMDLLTSKFYESFFLPYFKYPFEFNNYNRRYLEIRRLAIENPSLIYNIIKGYNPEGRIYGIKILLEMSSDKKIILEKKDVELIIKVLKLEIPIRTKSGDIISSVDSYDLFKNKELKELLSKNQIELK